MSPFLLIGPSYRRNGSRHYPIIAFKIRGWCREAAGRRAQRNRGHYLLHTKVEYEGYPLNPHRPAAIQVDEASRSVIQRSRAQKLPHLPERRMRLIHLRILQVHLNIVERGFSGSDLGNLIPAIVLLPPAIQKT